MMCAGRHPAMTGGPRATAILNPSSSPPAIARPPGHVWANQGGPALRSRDRDHERLRAAAGTLLVRRPDALAKTLLVMTVDPRVQGIRTSWASRPLPSRGAFTDRWAALLRRQPMRDRLLLSQRQESIRALPSWPPPPSPATNQPCPQAYPASPPRPRTPAVQPPRHISPRSPVCLAGHSYGGLRGLLPGHGDSG